ncbi:uncharacterized protein LW94_12596 [Fusarium fujikuroi]|nr:uncharacterized protein LW94_12596 [Fusarium fujikuroi]
MRISEGSPYPPSESDISEIPRDLEKEDAIAKLSLLPNPLPRPRCLTPSGFRDVAEKPGLPKPKPTFQHCAYYKLPPDMRRYILILAFGNRRLHMDLSYDYPDISPELIQPLEKNHCGIALENMHSIKLRAVDDTKPRSYAEAIGILYSKNTIIMANEAMITHLPQLLVPHRLASITSHEISWNLKSRYHSGIRNVIDEADLKHVCEIISTQFPQLRRLYLSLEKSRQLRAYYPEEVWSAISPHLDSLAQAMPSLTEHAISLPDTLFNSILWDAKRTDTGSYSEICHSYNQMWRSTDGKMDVIHLPYVDSYPKVPYHIPSSIFKYKGYWILNGTKKSHLWRFSTESSPLRGPCVPSYDSDSELYGDLLGLEDIF